MIEPGDIIYLDNNATTRIDPRVLEEMRPFLERYYGNPSSGYGFGAQVRSAIDLARERVAALLDCRPGEIVFTSGGTESSNTAIHSALRLDPARRHIVTSAVEHSATLRFCEALVKRGHEVTFLDVNGDGQLDLAELESAIRPETAIVSLMWANNETGVLFPVAEIAEITRRKRVPLHLDAVQAVGKVSVRLSETPANFVSVSAHKIYGPKGVGALYVDRRSAYRPMLIGGGQEDERRGGTENVAAIAGFGKAAELAHEQLDEGQTRVRALRDQFETTLQAQLANVAINGAAAPRLSNTASLSFAEIDAQAALILLDRAGICASAGSACRTGSPELSHVLRAMKLSEERIRGSIRFSFGRFNQPAEVERATKIIIPVVEKLRALGPAAG